MKDPAFLLYSGDFLVGVTDLSMEERGQYITLLCLQHQKGRLSKKAIKAALIADVSDDVISKFTVDDKGLFYNERLEHEIAKRAKHCDKQRENIGKRWGNNTKPIPNNIPEEYQSANQNDTKNIPLENENRNITENEVIDENEIVFTKLVREIIGHLNLLAGT